MQLKLLPGEYETLVTTHKSTKEKAINLFHGCLAGPTQSLAPPSLSTGGKMKNLWTQVRLSHTDLRREESNFVSNEQS